MQALARNITSRLLDALKVSPVVFLNGARQTGKSTLVQQIAGQIGTGTNSVTYISFDRPTQMAAAAAAPEAFLSAYKGSVIIDEVQLVPELFRALKVVVDESRIADKAKANGKYLLTGSANILALPKLSDPLVGRMSVLTLHPFSVAEAIGTKSGALERIVNMDFAGLIQNGPDIIEAMQLATFPEISGKTEQERNIWFDGYLSTLLQRDVRMLAELEKIAILPHLLRLLASRAGGLLNESDIARDAGLNSVTSKFYRNILKMMFLNFDVPPWHKNIGKRLVKAPKGYLSDTMLLCYLLGLKPRDMFSSRPELFGHVLENFVASELTKLLSFSALRGQLLHFRTSDGKEVDFVIEWPDGSILAIEVKKSESVTMHDFRGIQTLAEATGQDFKGGLVLYMGKEAVPFGKNLWAAPYNVLWS